MHPRAVGGWSVNHDHLGHGLNALLKVACDLMQWMHGSGGNNNKLMNIFEEYIGYLLVMHPGISEVWGLIQYVSRPI